MLRREMAKVIKGFCFEFDSRVYFVVEVGFANAHGPLIFDLRAIKL